MSNGYGYNPYYYPSVGAWPWGYVGQAPTPPPPPARALPDLNDPAVLLRYLEGKFALLLQLLIAAGVITREQEYGLHRGAYSIARLPARLPPP